MAHHSIKPRNRWCYAVFAYFNAVFKTAQNCSNLLKKCVVKVLSDSILLSDCCQKSDFFVSGKSLVFIKKDYLFLSSSPTLFNFVTLHKKAVRCYQKLRRSGIKQKRKRTHTKVQVLFRVNMWVSGGFKSRKRQESACVTPLLYIPQPHIVNITRFKTLEEHQPLPDLYPIRTWLILALFPKPTQNQLKFNS